MSTWRTCVVDSRTTHKFHPRTYTHLDRPSRLNSTLTHTRTKFDEQRERERGLFIRGKGGERGVFRRLGTNKLWPPHPPSSPLQQTHRHAVRRERGDHYFNSLISSYQYSRWTRSEYTGTYILFTYTHTSSRTHTYKHSVTYSTQFNLRWNENKKKISKHW